MCFYSVLISRHSWLYWLQNYLSCIELESLVSISWIMRWIKPEFGRDIAWYNSNEHHATSHYQKKQKTTLDHTHTHRHTDAQKKQSTLANAHIHPQRKETDVFLYTYTIDWLKLYSWKKNNYNNGCTHSSTFVLCWINSSLWFIKKRGCKIIWLSRSME